MVCLLSMYTIMTLPFFHQISIGLCSLPAVKPGPVVNLTVHSPNSTSLKVTFKTPHNLEHFPPGIKHRVTYKSQFDQNWTLADNGVYNSSLEDRLVTIQNLIPYGLYNVKVDLVSGKVCC